VTSERKVAPVPALLGCGERSHHRATMTGVTLDAVR
jgi:hypothetical protein